MMVVASVFPNSGFESPVNPLSSAASNRINIFRKTTPARLITRLITLAMRNVPPRLTLPIVHVLSVKEYNRGSETSRTRVDSISGVRSSPVGTRLIETSGRPAGVSLRAGQSSHVPTHTAFGDRHSRPARGCLFVATRNTTGHLLQSAGL